MRSPRLVVLLATLFAVDAAAAPPKAKPPAPPATRPTLSADPAYNLLLGNPSNATASVRDKDNYLQIHPFFVSSYNSGKGEPNWVSWVLTTNDLGSAPRKQTFDPDVTLPIGFVRIKHPDYTNSGFDRGHLCPHSDREANVAESYSTFVMTNVIPQAPNVNQKAWAQVEDFARDLAFQGNHVYQVAGGSGVGGVGRNGPAKDLGGRVTVPASCWKIIVVVPEAGGDDDLKKITPETRVIALHMPNDNTLVRDAWKQYRVSVRTIERETGYTFFSALPPVIAKALKEKTDEQETPAVIPKDYHKGKPTTEPSND